MKKMIIMTMAVLVVFTGCGTTQKQTQNAKSTEIEQQESNTKIPDAVIGSVVMNVNPELQINYDIQGNVIEIKALNEDAEVILADAERYVGMKCEVAVEEVINDIYDAGYLNQTVGGHDKNIVLMPTPDSDFPDTDFLDNLAATVNHTVSELKLESVPVIVTEESLTEEGIITLEKAKEIVLAQLGLSEANFTEKQYKLDDFIYEFEFEADGIKYEFEVDAKTGKVLEADYDNNSDWDDDDTEDDEDDTEDIEDDEDDIKDIEDDTEGDEDDEKDIEDDEDDTEDIEDDIDDAKDDTEDFEDDIEDEDGEVEDTD